MPALRNSLPPPLIIPPTSTPPTHTVIFLHRLPLDTPDTDLHSKVLSAKRTKNHKTLAEQFPTVRWVFPFAKDGPFPYTNLSAADRVAVGLHAKLGCPYIAQVVLQEAGKVEGGLENVVLGGQGETALAAHESLVSLPEKRGKSTDGEKREFVREVLHSQGGEAGEVKLGGFVGMHAEDREITRDVVRYATAKREAGEKDGGIRGVNEAVLVNTKHSFIHGGYKLKKEGVWDGRRIDDFASFLEHEVGVKRLGVEEVNEEKKKEKVEEKKEVLNESQKWAAELAKDKKANKSLRDTLMQRIEADKVERKIRLERERQQRAAIERVKAEKEAAGGSPGSPKKKRRWAGDTAGRIGHDVGSTMRSNFFTMGSGHVLRDDEDADEDSQEGFFEDHDDDDSIHGGHCARGETSWAAPSGIRGEMGETRMRAFGLINDKDGPVGKAETAEEK